MNVIATAKIIAAKIRFRDRPAAPAVLLTTRPLAGFPFADSSIPGPDLTGHTTLTAAGVCGTQTKPDPPAENRGAQEATSASVSTLMAPRSPARSAPRLWLAAIAAGA